MVHARAGLAAARRGRAGHNDDGHLFREGADDGVENAQAADAVGHHGPAEALETGVAVGRVTGVQLVAGADPANGAGEDFVEEIEDVVAGHAEEVVHARLLQALQNIARNRAILRHGRSFPVREPVASPRCRKSYHG